MYGKKIIALERQVACRLNHILYRATVWRSCSLSGRPSINLEDKIRELCAKAVATKDSLELSPILSQLRTALHEYDALAKELMAERTRMLNPNVGRLGSK